jgi:hypothetical protein
MARRDGPRSGGPRARRSGASRLGAVAAAGDGSSVGRAGKKRRRPGAGIDSWEQLVLARRSWCWQGGAGVGKEELVLEWTNEELVLALSECCVRISSSLRRWLGIVRRRIGLGDVA